ncbi:MAG: hypothetical protein LBL30_01315 [Holosporales bacterium]|jgi:SAM-dependent methyltransferase|nr:hypothetical protein [Holosporales bacterium]
MINKSKAAILVTALFVCITSQASTLPGFAPEDPLPEIEPGYTTKIKICSSPSHDTERASILPPKHLLADNGINFRDVRAYFEHCECNGLTKTLIVGAMRGSGIPSLGHNDTEKICWATVMTDLDAYGLRAYNFFLIDIGLPHDSLESKFGFSPSPDMIMDVINLSRQTLGLRPDQEGFDRVIFENLPLNIAFSPRAVANALDVLKPNGLLISSGFPEINLVRDDGEFKDDPSFSKITLVGGKLAFYYKLDDDGCILLHSYSWVRCVSFEECQDIERAIAESFPNIFAQLKEYFGPKIVAQTTLGLRNILTPHSSFWQSDNPETWPRWEFGENPLKEVLLFVKR